MVRAKFFPYWLYSHAVAGVVWAMAGFVWAMAAVVPEPARVSSTTAVRGERLRRLGRIKGEQQLESILG